MVRALAIFLSLAISAAAIEPFDMDRFLSALRMVETGNEVRDGAHGERGPWQVTPVVWSMHMPGRSFDEARQEDVARECVVRHLTLIRNRLRESGCDDNAFNLALAWNAGLARMLAGRAPLGSYDHALRVSNLYSAATNQNPVTPPEPILKPLTFAFTLVPGR